MTTTKQLREDRETVREFLALPVEAMPSACYQGDGEYSGHAWDMLRNGDWEIAPAPIRLYADVDGWRKGVMVGGCDEGGAS